MTLGTLVMASTRREPRAPPRRACADHRAGRRAQWRLKGAVALALGLAAVVLQVVEWTTIGFGPADGGYASVFFGWTAFNVLFVVGTLFWLENLLATAIRYRKVPAGGSAGAGPRLRRPGPARTRHRRSALARAAGARVPLLLLGVPRRARRPGLDRPLPPLGV